MAFVGRLAGLSRDDAEALVAEAGGTVASDFATCAYVVAGGLTTDGSMVIERTAAYRAARASGLPILDEAKFQALLTSVPAEAPRVGGAVSDSKIDAATTTTRWTACPERDPRCARGG